ncbi:benzoate/H(+) symporter BenE family transporter [Nocardia otitidiscaviarum]|uniref:Benzoate/H(+) symporter BenE family transporter n=1 Tax=Nocardia otitidiscaviarum TaxID=1823 RepID=A0A516NRR8_9NOCA|nr:benzoate/H(+) symporter BenE family transporter [Nocardia otitidiscaviarum]MCP9620744.1 benzoate/H(+) symporter BenE family transporter [Nocardia otitidiscaviarum]QDP81544.1 benzoate/H(+) symporter BenE family transporter [Nocardia otitidiscaviarum]
MSSTEVENDTAVAASPDRSVGLGQPIGAGIVTALVGFTSSFAVVLAGLTAVGASSAQAASGLMAVCITQGLGILLLSRRYRIPITLAWSTPGAALLASTGAVAGGWPAAVGAFVITGALIVVTGYWQRLGALIAAIPVEIAQAMLAGVLLPLCLAPMHALTVSPAVVAPVIVVWLLLQRYAARWAVLAAFAVAAVGAGIEIAVRGRGLELSAMVPRFEPTVPHWSWQAMIGLAVPLYIVTMAAQNIPGTAVMSSFGYRVPWRPAMAVTGLGTMLGAPAGGHAINLAAISAALAAAPSAHPDPKRRWVAAASAGATYLLLALVSAALVALVAAAPEGVLETVAALALIATLAAALTAALAPAEHRSAAALTFLVAASGISLLGIGAAFWALVAGLVVRWFLRPPV